MSIQNIEAEQTVLGSLLLEGELIKEWCLTLLHFYKMIRTNSLLNIIYKTKHPSKKEKCPINLTKHPHLQTDYYKAKHRNHQPSITLHDYPVLQYPRLS